MSFERKLAQLGVEEGALSAVCWAMARLRSDVAKLFTMLANEHHEAAEALGNEGAPVHEVLAAARTLMQQMLRPGGALGWVREREHKLVYEYLALDTLPDAGDDERHRLRRELLPAAFSRYTRVDRLIAALEIEAGGEVSSG